MTTASPVPPGSVLRVVLGVSRARILPLRLAYEAHNGVRVIASYAAAAEVLNALEGGLADGAIVDEDLHGLNRARLGIFKERRWPLVMLSRLPEAAQWQGLVGPVLAPETDPVDMLNALQRAVHGEYRLARSNQPRKRANPKPPAAQLEPQTVRSEVIALWSGRSGPGKTTLGLNSVALEGAVEPTVLVELDTMAASLVAYLDDGRDGQPRRASITLLELAGAALRTSAEWDQALGSTLQPLGSYSPHARVLFGIAHPEQRTRLTDPAAFVESLLTELRRRFARVWLDLGSDPVGGEATEALIGATALRLADRILVVTTPEPASVHRTRMAVREAGDRLERGGVGLVVNRVDPHDRDVSWISNAVGLPILGILPADDRAQRRALAAAVPVVRDPDSRLRRPLTHLLEQLGSVSIADTFVPAPRPARRAPLLGQLRTAMSVFSTLAGPR